MDAARSVAGIASLTVKSSTAITRTQGAGVDRRRTATGSWDIFTATSSGRQCSAGNGNGLHGLMSGSGGKAPVSQVACLSRVRQKAQARF
jgi:hypothetical protein